MSLALYVVAAIEPRLRALDRGRPEVFRARRAVVRHAALRRSLIYGFTGTVSFAGIAKASAQGGIGLIFGLVFLFAGFCFKVSAVPFHMWTPDVYEGAPTPVTAFFAAAPKVAAMAMFVRAPSTAFPDIAPQWQQIVVFVVDRLDGARRVRGDRPDQHQAADGLFLDRPHGLRAGRARRRHRRGRAGRADLYGDLSSP